MRLFLFSGAGGRGVGAQQPGRLLLGGGEALIPPAHRPKAERRRKLHEGEDEKVDEAAGAAEDHRRAFRGRPAGDLRQIMIFILYMYFLFSKY
ncbi:hypothetical protein AXF42_Ash003750 [Apostasia shenzhenica]|uniref:Uncharacterized protein n=1 Tax=Apostasia shenzhenica TaxID=1088818 RepID=A0A2I0AHT2_9ASPA|nr:hypothetical protein AXF42_Ash003750 [Apostasia shenzhenica]